MTEYYIIKLINGTLEIPIESVPKDWIFHPNKTKPVKPKKPKKLNSLIKIPENGIVTFSPENGLVTF